MTNSGAKTQFKVQIICKVSNGELYVKSLINIDIYKSEPAYCGRLGSDSQHLLSAEDELRRDVSPGAEVRIHLTPLGGLGAQPPGGSGASPQYSHTIWGRGPMWRRRSLQDCIHFL